MYRKEFLEQCKEQEVKDFPVIVRPKFWQMENVNAVLRIVTL